MIPKNLLKVIFSSVCSYSQGWDSPQSSRETIFVMTFGL